MPWQDSREKPPPKIGVYRLQRKDKNDSIKQYSYWNGEYFCYTASSAESALRYKTEKSVWHGEYGFWWEEGVDQPYMKANQEKGLPARNGAAWTIEEEEQLLDEVRQGLSFAQIAEKHERVERAIEIRTRVHNGQTADRWDEKIFNAINSKAIAKLGNLTSHSFYPSWDLRTTSRNKLLLLL